MSQESAKAQLLEEIVHIEVTFNENTNAWYVIMITLYRPQYS